MDKFKRGARLCRFANLAGAVNYKYVVKEGEEKEEEEEEKEKRTERRL